MNLRRVRAALVAGAAATLIAACGTTSTSTTTTAASAEVTAEVAAATGTTVEAALAANDGWVTSSETGSGTTITLDGDTATSDSAGVTVDGNTVTITAAGTYVLSGDLDGQVVVDTADSEDVVLVLDGATITSPSSAGIAVTNAETVVLSLADGTTNTVADTADHADDGTTAAIDSAPTW